jgi:hypothetical protein
MYLLNRWYLRTATTGAGAPECRRNRTAVAYKRSRLRRLQLNRLMPLSVFSIGVPSLVTAYPSQAAANGATIQRVPITTTTSTLGATIYDGTIQ